MWFTQEPRAGQAVAHEIAWNHMLNYLHERATAERWADWKAMCFTEYVLPASVVRVSLTIVIGLTVTSDTLCSPPLSLAHSYSEPKMLCSQLTATRLFTRAVRGSFPRLGVRI